MEEELKALLILNSIPQLSSLKIRSLIQEYGSASAVLAAPSEKIGYAPSSALKNSLWQEDVCLAERSDTQLIPFMSPRYPKRLREIADYPLILYVKGKLMEKDQKCLAIVGTRNATIYGLEMAKQIGADLAQAGYTIVSGLARGIDTAAHQGALETGRTVAIMGSGLNCIYPKENLQLAENICQKGALLSEFPMKNAPQRYQFPQRNRLVSGLSMGTLLIEAPLKSGAMITMEKSMQQDRPLFAIPGRIDLDNFKGNHALIKQKKAQLVESAQDILHYFEENPLLLPPTLCTAPSLFLEKEEEEVLAGMPHLESSIEELVLLFKWPVPKLNSVLMSLVLKKLIKEYPGKIYKKLKRVS